jgi:hypothetical protein
MNTDTRPEIIIPVQVTECGACGGAFDRNEAAHVEEFKPWNPRIKELYGEDSIVRVYYCTDCTKRLQLGS